MIQHQITIINNLGLHARASAKLTKLAGSYPCQVFLTRGERRVNAKSIMGVMMLAAGLGSDIEVETDGEQEQEAMDALLALINDKFGRGTRHRYWTRRAGGVQPRGCGPLFHRGRSGRA